MYRVTYRGKEYTSLKSLHTQHAAPGLSYGLFRRRVVTLRWDVDHALTTPANQERKRTYGKRVTVQGDTEDVGENRDA